MGASEPEEQSSRTTTHTSTGNVDGASAPGKSTFRGLLRVEVLAICFVAFLADIMSGILAATFSLYAEDLGATVVFIGVLTSLTGLTALIGSVPIGILSDQVGRIQVLTFGLGSFSLAMLLLAIAPSPALLVPGRLLLGLAMVGSFWIAAAYLGDVVTPSERGLAFGLLTTAMGLGFAVGPLVGGVVSERVDTRAAYLLAAAVGVVAVAVILLVLQGRQPIESLTSRPRVSVRESLRVGRNWSLIAVGIGNILSAIAFGGAVATIFPLRADSLGISAAAIGSMFAFRAIASTIVRLPSGALTGIVGTRQVILGALVIEMIAVAGIGTSTRYAVMLVWLIAEGVGYGAFLASAQAYIAENTIPATRGAAIGFYSMTGGIGNTLAPVVLGVVGSVLGLGAVFFVSSALLAVGLFAMCWIWFRMFDSASVPGTNEVQAFVGGGVKE